MIHEPGMKQATLEAPDLLVLKSKKYFQSHAMTFMTPTQKKPDLMAAM